MSNFKDEINLNPYPIAFRFILIQQHSVDVSTTVTQFHIHTFTYHRVLNSTSLITCRTREIEKVVNMTSERENFNEEILPSSIHEPPNPFPFISSCRVSHHTTTLSIISIICSRWQNDDDNDHSIKKDFLTLRRSHCIAKKIYHENVRGEFLMT